MIKKVYLSRAMTRAMALEHPIGDPTGGPAYGERRDPVSAVVAGAEMFTTGEAVMAGTASLFEGLTFAGGALSLVGNVTGNKTLSQLGTVASLAGGVGQLADWATSGVTSPSGDGNLADNSAPEANAPGAAPNATPTPANPTPADLAAKNVINPADANLANVQSSINPAQANTPVQTGAPVAAPSAPSALNSPTTPQPGLLSQGMNWIKQNPMAAYIGAQAVGGAADMVSGLTPAKVAALKAQADATNYQTQLAKDNIARLNAGYSQVNQGIAINPNVNTSLTPATQFVMMPPQNTGLIAGAKA